MRWNVVHIPQITKDFMAYYSHVCRGLLKRYVNCRPPFEFTNWLDYTVDWMNRNKENSTIFFLYMHLGINWIKRTIDIQENLKIVKIYVQSQWRVVLSWYHIFWPSSIQRGRHTQLCIITSLKWIIQICSNFYCWVCKIAFYSPNPHCCLGKLPL